MKNVSAVIILVYIYIMAKEKDSVNDPDIKNRQLSRSCHIYLYNIDIINIYIKDFIKNWRLGIIPSKEIIKIDINQESFIKIQESIKNEIHLHVTIK